MDVTVTKDEVDKQQFDATQVDGKDPDRVYRWARDEDRNIRMHELHGYQIVERTTEQSILSDRTRMKKGQDNDNSIRWGDMVLMSIPRMLFEKRIARERALIVRRTQGVTEEYKSAMARITGNSNAAFEEHRHNPSMRTVTEEMTPEQAVAALELNNASVEDSPFRARRR